MDGYTKTVEMATHVLWNIGINVFMDYEEYMKCIPPILQEIYTAGFQKAMKQVNEGPPSWNVEN